MGFLCSFSWISLILWSLFVVSRQLNPQCSFRLSFIIDPGCRHLNPHDHMMRKRLAWWQAPSVHGEWYPAALQSCKGAVRYSSQCYPCMYPRRWRIFNAHLPPMGRPGGSSIPSTQVRTAASESAAPPFEVPSPLSFKGFWDHGLTSIRDAGVIHPQSYSRNIGGKTRYAIFGSPTSNPKLSPLMPLSPSLMVMRHPA